MEREHNTQSYKNIWELYILSAFASLGWAVTGYNFSVYNPTLNHISKSMEWPEDQTPLRHGLGFAMIPAGALLTLIIILWKFPNSGRRKLLIIADVFTIAGAVLTTINNYWIFLAGRLLLGFAVGINGPMVPIYIRETAPTKISGKMGGFVGIGSSFGKLLGFALAFGLPVPPSDDDSFWRIMYAVPALLSIARIIYLVIFYHYDTPKYYVLKEKDEKAKKVLDKIYHEEDAHHVLHDIRHERVHERKITFKTLKDNYRTQLTIAIMLTVLLQLSGFQTITAYSTSILTGSLLNHDLEPGQIMEINIINLCMGVTRILSSGLTGIFMDKFGRKKFLIVGTFFQATSLFILAISVQINETPLSEAMILVYSLGIAMGLAIINPVYISEVLPASGCNLMQVIDNSMNLLLNFSFPLSVSVEGFGFSGVIYGMGAITLLGFIGIIYFVIETKGMSMYEIYEMFNEINKKKGKGELLGDDESEPMLQ